MNAEDRLISWLRDRLRRRGSDLLGDDAAVLPGAGNALVTVDQQIAGVHFPADLPPHLVARRLLAVGLSDIAAMGGSPRHAFVALTVPAGFEPRPFFDGLLAACARFGIVLAGGDLARGPVLAASLTVCGGRHRRARIVRRSDARPGDALWIGDSLGEAAAGRWLVAAGARLEGPSVRLPPGFSRSAALRRAARRAVRRHLTPRPQLELGRWLAGRSRAAAIDVSDGLAIDLHRLCRESRVGARVDAASLPQPRQFARLARELGRSPLEMILGGGEDYALLFALPAGLEPPRTFAARRIGNVVCGRRLSLLRGGRASPLAASGWDHLA